MPQFLSIHDADQFSQTGRPLKTRSHLRGSLRSNLCNSRLHQGPILEKNRDKFIKQRWQINRIEGVGESAEAYPVDRIFQILVIIYIYN